MFFRELFCSSGCVCAHVAHTRAKAAEEKNTSHTRRYVECRGIYFRPQQVVVVCVCIPCVSSPKALSNSSTTAGTTCFLQQLPPLDEYGRLLSRRSCM